MVITDVGGLMPFATTITLGRYTAFAEKLKYECGTVAMVNH